MRVTRSLTCLLTRIAAALCVGALALPASASPVSYQFTGQVSNDDANRGWSGFVGSFSFDSGAIDGIPDASTAAYAHAGAPWGISVSFDGGPAITLNSTFNMLVSNNLGGMDQLGALGQDAGGTQTISLSLLDFSQALFASDALPLSALQLSDFGWSSFSYEVAGDSYLDGVLTSLSCTAGCSDALPPPPPPASQVSEPASLALLLSGLFSAAAASRRRSRNRSCKGG